MAAFSFLQRLRPVRAAAPSLPTGERIYAIGDVHGRADLLRDLTESIMKDDAGRAPAETQIILLGDLVDRGEDSKGVLDQVLRLQASGHRVRVLRGNHDQVFEGAVRGDARMARRLHHMGGRTTFLSYGISPSDYDSLDYPALVERLRALVPADHLRLLASMEDVIAVGDYLFVHAGVRPGVPVHEQAPEDLYWIRGDFLHHRGDFGGYVVHGHSIVDEVEMRSNRCAIDTGAYRSGRLTAIGLEGEERWLLST